ncbi:MAG: hypothetical protein A2136_08730 [Chloroflexi bacterium RBG_16_54_11]|nr:MAG: hypothetical protein A2136_08730 [Chloroflexi bacterium RBG_16_54_11]
MFEPYVISDDGFENVIKNGEIIGYQLKTRIAYYRGVPLSMVDKIELVVDDEPVAIEKIHFTVADETFTLKEMETVTSTKWEFGQQATISVNHPGGLNPGVHKVFLSQTTRVAYYPFPLEGRRTRFMTIA